MAWSTRSAEGLILVQYVRLWYLTGTIWPKLVAYIYSFSECIQLWPKLTSWLFLQKYIIWLEFKARDNIYKIWQQERMNKVLIINKIVFNILYFLKALYFPVQFCIKIDPYSLIACSLFLSQSFRSNKNLSGECFVYFVPYTS